MYGALLLNVATEDATCQTCLDLFLQKPLKWASAVHRVIATISNPTACCFIKLNMNLPIRQTVIQMTKQQSNDLCYLLKRKWLKQYNVCLLYTSDAADD